MDQNALYPLTIDDAKESSSSSATPITVSEVLTAPNASKPSSSSDISDEDVCGFSHSEFSFSCIYPKCSFKASLTNDLYTHIRAHDEMSSEKPWRIECPHCGIKRTSMSMMVNHVRTHTEERPYKCPLPNCLDAFTTKGILRQHLVSQRHRDSVSLQMLNHILSFDTKHGRPQQSLRGPRDRVNNRAMGLSLSPSPNLFSLPMTPSYYNYYQPQYGAYHQQNRRVQYDRYSPMYSVERFQDTEIREISKYQ